MEKNSNRNYYSMGSDEDIFTFLETLPIPGVRDTIVLATIGIWATGFRYARRCLWKGLTEKVMADDARKAADCFTRLADLLDSQQENNKNHDEERPMQSRSFTSFSPMVTYNSFGDFPVINR